VVVSLRLYALLIAAVLLIGGTAQANPTTPAGNSKTVCAYAFHHIGIFKRFQRMVGRTIDCALVYNDASPGWAGWENPWLTHHPDPDLNWGKWATAAGTTRTLIITQNLFPASVNGSNWRSAGARGAYAGHARALARNLVAAGLGSAVIRLGHEANGDWYPDSIGSTRRDFSLWRKFWRRTVLAMRSVPGANFRFDWSVNASYRPIPFRLWYPGDDVVDYIGIDAYDSGIRSMTHRWNVVFGRTLGVRDAIAFARAHRKPLSIPEWGVGTRGLKSLAGGDDPAYVDGIASVVRRNRVAYQCYFYAHEWARQLRRGTRSLRSYRRHFGARGDSVGSARH
jgi:glycosyl hydrolase family 26